MAKITVPPVARVLRTAVQLLVAFPAVVPTLVELLHVCGVRSIDTAGLLAVAATALAIVVAVQNWLEHAGVIPTIGAKQVIDTTGHELAYTEDEVRRIIGLGHEDESVNARGRLEEARAEKLAGRS